LNEARERETTMARQRKTDAQIQESARVTHTPLVVVQGSGRALFSASFEQQYEVARRLGDARFGGECRHEVTWGGHCANCLRKVVG
jgi:hypothetical protein